MSGVEVLARKLVSPAEVSDEAISVMSWGHDMFRDLPGDKLMSLASYYGITPNREEKDYPQLLHGKVAASYLSSRYEIDEDVARAIFWHVSGSVDMGKLGELLLIADMGEEGRSFHAASEIRSKAFLDKKKTVLDVLRFKMLWSLSGRRPLLDDTVTCWNYYLRRDLGDTD